MFARIAGRYDLLNRVLSMGIDRGWRRRTVAAAGDGARGLVVDACCGTGDLSRDFAAAGARVVGVDFTPEMLEHAGPKVGDVSGSAIFVHGDALALPLPSSVADVASVAFGLRNVRDPDAGLAELARVVRPGGIVMVLEFSHPPGRVLGALYGFYSGHVLPRVGALLSGDRAAYRYLPETVSRWPAPDELSARMRAVGLVDCGYTLLTGGIAALHTGRVPSAPR